MRCGLRFAACGFSACGWALRFVVAACGRTGAWRWNLEFGGLARGRAAVCHVLCTRVLILIPAIRHIATQPKCGGTYVRWHCGRDMASVARRHVNATGDARGPLHCHRVSLLCALVRVRVCVPLARTLTLTSHSYTKRGRSETPRRVGHPTYCTAQSRTRTRREGSAHVASDRTRQRAAPLGPLVLSRTRPTCPMGCVPCAPGAGRRRILCGEAGLAGIGGGCQ